MLPQLIHFFIVLFISVNPLWSKETIVLEEKQLFEAELSLAQKPKIYFIFNIKEKKIHLKARGSLLREWEIEKIRFWGNPVPITPFSLVKKSTPFTAKRESIKPDNYNEKNEFELQALESIYMPTSYSLYMEGGILIYIRPKPGGLISMLYSLNHTYKWYTFSPLQAVWFSVRKRSFTAIDIVLRDKKEAQALYWAFLEGLEAIIF